MIELESDFRWEEWAGIDESWFSPVLVGPCAYAAVWLSKLPPEPESWDSKRLSPKRKLELASWVALNGVYAVVLATPQDFALLGLEEAKRLSVQAVKEGLTRRLEVLGVGPVRFMGDLGLKKHVDWAFRDADATSLLVGAASIIAWVYREGLPEGWHQLLGGTWAQEAPHSTGSQTDSPGKGDVYSSLGSRPQIRSRMVGNAGWGGLNVLQPQVIIKSGDRGRDV